MHIENKGRRGFLKLAGAAAAAGAVSLAASCQPKAEKIPSIDHGLSEKSFWEKVQQQFALDPNRVYMNIGTTGPMPRRVLQNYDRYNRLAARTKRI